MATSAAGGFTACFGKSKKKKEKEKEKEKEKVVKSCNVALQDLTTLENQRRKPPVFTCPAYLSTIVFMVACVFPGF